MTRQGVLGCIQILCPSLAWPVSHQYVIICSFDNFTRPHVGLQALYRCRGAGKSPKSFRKDAKWKVKRGIPGWDFGFFWPSCYPTTFPFEGFFPAHPHPSSPIAGPLEEFPAQLLLEHQRCSSIRSNLDHKSKRAEFGPISLKKKCCSHFSVDALVNEKMESYIYIYVYIHKNI